ncbi:sensor histidine kinase [Streptomyces sp. NBC_00286]|uniref:sensor histidine kinase n=1 Tax=Streptomyces sp. NBC_00286 TaxID=2975701 RepID=UPI002E289EB7|nr:ATP-binding protein [Streptomyces sp. NBC_00286]
MTAPIPPARPSTDRPSLAHSRGERPSLRAVAPAPLIAAVPTALAVVGAVVAAPESFRVPLGFGAGAAALLLCAVVAFASHATQKARLLRRRLEAVTDDAGRLLQERARIAEVSAREQARLTKEFERVRVHEADQFAQEKTRLSAELAQERARLGAENARLAEELRRTRTEGGAAISAAANAAGRMQAQATSMLADLRAMEEKHSDEDVLADLLHLDHRTAQAGRLADSVAVLAGARSGRRWARPIVMESILRGAMGRIGGYQRVRLHSASEAAVAGHAAEGVMHALAELLDNAANFSPPTSEVHVYVEEVPAGVIVSVEDAGLVMGDVQLRRAERAVAGETTEIGGLTGTRLGLAVVGRLARKYGLKVSFRPSARGGTGVLVLIPQDILAGPGATEPAPAALPRARSGVEVQIRASGAYGLTGPAASESAPDALRTEPGVEVEARTPGAYGPTGPAAPESTPTAPRAKPGVEVQAQASGAYGLTGPSASESAPTPPRAKPGVEIQARTSGAYGLTGPVAPEPAPAWPQTKPEGQTQSQARTAGAYGLTGPAAPESAPGSRQTTPRLPVPIPTHTPESYATARALPDLDPEPVPTHESPDRTGESASTTGTGTGTGSISDSEPDTVSGLPKRRRGRTLAEAEAQAAAAAQTERTRPAASSPRPTPAENARIRAARFGSFRQAVRGATASEAVRADGADRVVRDTAPDTEPTATPQPPARATPHPEGDPTP